MGTSAVSASDEEGPEANQVVDLADDGRERVASAQGSATAFLQECCCMQARQVYAWDLCNSKHSAIPIPMCKFHALSSFQAICTSHHTISVIKVYVLRSLQAVGQPLQSAAI